MKKIAVFVILACSLLGLHLAFKNQGKTISELKEAWMKNTQLVSKSVNTIQALTKGEYSDAEFKSQVQEAVKEARLAYKEFEFLYAYYYPNHVKSKINGAPLLHLDPFYPKPVVLPPNGLQRIDELAYAEISTDGKAELTKLSKKLFLDFRPIKQNVKIHPIEQRELIEAMRSQLIRLFSLGLTGFDTPGSLNAISEAKASLRGMKTHALPIFLNAGEYKVCNDLFTDAIKYLDENQDFETFDRLHFLKQYVNPLYKALYELHVNLNIETIDEVFTLELPVNYASTNIFDPAFLNPYYYSNLRKADDSPQLQALGEKLFYSKKLSGNGKMSCATCHKPNMAFADGLKTPLAADGTTHLDRNSPTLINAVYSKRFFADMRARRFDDQMEHVITNHKEFNTSYFNIFKKLEADEEFSSLFTEAFENQKEPINQNNFNLTLNAYLLSLTSFNSPFDQYVRNERSALPEKAKQGFNLFMGKAACGTCHFAPTFAGLVPPQYDESESEVLGVLEKADPQNPVLDADRGHANNDIPKESDVYFYENSFKTSTVRNAALTAPYFHNGAYQTLEEVVEFYNHGGGAGLGLNADHQTLPSDSLFLTPLEKSQLVAFMQALTDSAYVAKEVVAY